MAQKQQNTNGSVRKRKIVQRLRVRTKRVLDGSTMTASASQTEKEVKKLIAAAITNKDIEIDVEMVRKWPKEGIHDAFNVAVEHGNVKLVRDLGEFVSKPQFGDALIRCSRCGHEDVASALLDMKAYLDYRKDNQTPLIAAVKHEQQSMVKYLLSKKADIFTIDGHQNSILHIAAKMGDRGICKLALENGTLPHVLNEEEKTPIELAKTEDVARTILTTYLNKVREEKGDILDPYDTKGGPPEAIECMNPFKVELAEGSRLGELFWSGIYNMSLHQQRCLTTNYDLFPFDRLQFREKTVVLYKVAEWFGQPSHTQSNYGQQKIACNLLHECALYAIFEMIFIFVKHEIVNDNDGSTFKWRTKVIYAFEEVYNLDSADFGLSEKCRTVEVWRPLIELILYVFFGQAFWDKKRLFKCRNVLERREFILKYRVSEDYFRSSLPEKPEQNPNTTQAQINRVMEMCHQKLTLNLKHIKWNRCCKCLNCFLNSTTSDFLQPDTYSPHPIRSKQPQTRSSYKNRFTSLQDLRLRSKNELSKFWNSISTEKWTMTEITIEELEEIICYTSDWETLRAALESYTKFAWDSDLLEIQDHLVTIADDMSDARGMEELLAEVLEAVTQPAKQEDRRTGAPEWVVDIQHLREVVGLGNVYDSLQQLGNDSSTKQNDIWERYGRQMLENLVLCEFARKVAEEYVRQRDESHARAAALELELELIAEEEAQQKTKKKRKKKKKKRKKTETPLPIESQPAPAPTAHPESSPESKPTTAHETLQPQSPDLEPKGVKKMKLNNHEESEVPKKSELSSEYNDSNPFAMLNSGTPAEPKNTAKPLPEKKKKKVKKKRRGKKKNKQTPVETPQPSLPPKADVAHAAEAPADTSVKANSNIADHDSDSTSFADGFTPVPRQPERPSKRKRNNQLTPVYTTVKSSKASPVTTTHSPIKAKSYNPVQTRPPQHTGSDKRVVVKSEKIRPSSRNLASRGKDPWAWTTKYVDGMMFVCNNDTYEECLKIKLLGLPRQYLKNVQGLRTEQQQKSALFLFNMSNRLLYGVFEATEAGGENLNRSAWNRNADSRGGSRYPAQVPFIQIFEFKPLPEQAFRHMFSDGNRIRKLDPKQVREILQLFIQHHTKRSAGGKSAVKIAHSSASSSNPWKTTRSKTPNSKPSLASFPDERLSPSPAPSLSRGQEKSDRDDRSSRTSYTSSPPRTMSEESKEESELPTVPEISKSLITTSQRNADLHSDFSQSVTPDPFIDDLNADITQGVGLLNTGVFDLGQQELTSSPSNFSYPYTHNLVESTQGLINTDMGIPRTALQPDDERELNAKEEISKQNAKSLSLFLLSQNHRNIWGKGTSQGTW